MIKFKTGLVTFIFLLLLKNILIAKDDFLKVYYEEISTGGFNIFADNSNIIPCFLKIEFTELNNLNCSEKLPFSIVLKPESKRNPIVSLLPIVKTASYSFKYNVKFTEGDPDAKPDELFTYLFPFEHGKKYHLTQGVNGKFTHYDENKYSYDFEMDVGTPIAAARDGIVVGIKDDSNFGGPDASYSDYANYILIYHSDGTFGNYVHLKQNGVLVKVREQIKAGMVIGYSGNTGRSSGPHLHFDVRVATVQGKKQSIPIKFLNYDSTAISPEQGEYYYSYNPEKPKFEVILGKNITDKDYENYSVKVDLTDTIEIRDEQIDSTFLFFAQNGFNEEKKVTVDFKIKNLTASKLLPYTFVVPAKKEIFILLLRVTDVKEKYEFSIEYSYPTLRK